MTKHRRTKRRSQKGGFWPFTSTDLSTDPNAQKGWFDWSTWGTKATDTTTAVNAFVGDAANTLKAKASSGIEQASELLNKEVSFSGQPTTTDIPSTNSQYPATGGRRKRTKSMNGGSRKRRRSHRTRRHKKR